MTRITAIVGASIAAFVATASAASVGSADAGLAELGLAMLRPSSWIFGLAGAALIGLAAGTGKATSATGDWSLDPARDSRDRNTTPRGALLA